MSPGPHYDVHELRLEVGQPPASCMGNDLRLQIFFSIDDDGARTLLLRIHLGARELSTLPIVRPNIVPHVLDVVAVTSSDATVVLLLAASSLLVVDASNGDVSHEQLFDDCWRTDEWGFRVEPVGESLLLVRGGDLLLLGSTLERRWHEWRWLDEVVVHVDEEGVTIESDWSERSLLRFDRSRGPLPPNR